MASSMIYYSSAAYTRKAKWNLFVLYIKSVEKREWQIRKNIINHYLIEIAE